MSDLSLISMKPDVELAEYLTGRISVVTGPGETADVVVYSDGERPTNGVANDFIDIFLNGGINGIAYDADFARGNIGVSLYCKMNDDGTVKKNRVERLLDQFYKIVNRCLTEHYYYEYDFPMFLTPTTPDYSSGYSVTTINLRWHSTNN